MRSWKMSAMLLAAVMVMPLTAAAGGHHHHGSDVDFYFSYCNHPVYYDPWVVEFVDYYGCSPVVVERYRTRGFPGEDLAVAVYLAHRSGTSLGVIVDWRRHGMDWYDITRRCNLSPAVFITPVYSHHDVCGVYARPYARWRSHRDNWRFSDYEARELAYLHFATERYNRDPKWVMHERSRGRDWQRLANARTDDDSRSNRIDRSPNRRDKDDDNDNGKSNRKYKQSDRKSNKPYRG